MRKSSHNFSMLEILLVIVIVALVMSVTIPAFQKRSPGQVKIEMTDALSSAFYSAASRAQSFGKQVKLVVQADADGVISCQVINEVVNPELPVILDDQAAEQSFNKSQQDEQNQRFWAGDLVYKLPAEIKLFDDFTDGEEIYFRFFPDGEATGPDLVLQQDERRYRLGVDRLKGQMVLFELENRF